MGQTQKLSKQMKDIGVVYYNAGGVWRMSDLQEQAIQIIGEMPEESLKVLVQFMRMFIQSPNNPATDAEIRSTEKRVKEIGIAEGEKLYDHDYDLDECNDQISNMFGVMG